MKNLYTIILFLFFFSLQAQNYYYNGSEKIEVQKSNQSFISFDKSIQTFAKGFKHISIFSVKEFTLLEGKKASFSTRAFRRQKLNQTSPALILNSKNDFKIFPTKTICVKLKPNAVIEDITKLFGKSEILKIEDKYGVLRININDIHKALEIANKIYESGLAEFSIPDFYIPMVLNQVNDSLFSQQFQMHNTGQLINGLRGVNDIDCNALEAWNITLGDGVTVAVVDTGMEDHEDFEDRLIGGHTPANNGNGTPIGNKEAHGMNSAGVIGASDNNLGIRGVAPNVNFLSVNIFTNGSTQRNVADGIIWAVDNGADVISNSWGYKNAPCGFSSIFIDNAINYAVTMGREGKGAVVVAAAGNKGSCLEYPASSAKVISVGAIDHRGNLFHYSARGAQLDLVAPSGSGSPSGYSGVRTLDRMDTAGNNNGNYEYNFGGTSAACPVVSGVAALVLSMNPNLTWQDVRGILVSTATDMGATGFDNNFGFGRVNALGAVKKTISKIQITGNSTICNSNTFFSLSQVPGGIPVSWSVSPNLQIISSSTAGATIKAINNSVQGNGFVKITLASRAIIKKNVWVGAPSAVTGLSHVSTFGCTMGEINVYSGGSGAEQYEWVISGGKIVVPNINSNRYTGRDEVIFVDPADSPYGFGVKVRAKNNCGYSSWYTKYIPTNCSLGGSGRYRGGRLTPLSNSIVLDDNITFFPNPASETVFVNLNSLTNDDKDFDFQIKLLDINGRIIFETKTNRIFKQIDISRVNNGIYILNLSNGKKNITQKLIIKH